jgi:hypothetical protein
VRDRYQRFALGRSRFDWIASLGAKNTIASGLVNLGVSLNEDIADEAEYTQRLAEKFRFFKQARYARKAGFTRLEMKVRCATIPRLTSIALQGCPTNGAEAVTFQMLTSIEFLVFPWRYEAISDNSRGTDRLPLRARCSATLFPASGTCRVVAANNRLAARHSPPPQFYAQYPPGEFSLSTWENWSRHG